MMSPARRCPYKHRMIRQELIAAAMIAAMATVFGAALAALVGL